MPIKEADISYPRPKPQEPKVGTKRPRPGSGGTVKKPKPSRH